MDDPVILLPALAITGLLGVKPGFLRAWTINRQHCPTGNFTSRVHVAGIIISRVSVYVKYKLLHACDARVNVPRSTMQVDCYWLAYGLPFSSFIERERKHLIATWTALHDTLCKNTLAWSRFQLVNAEYSTRTGRLSYMASRDWPFVSSLKVQSRRVKISSCRY